MIYPDWDSIFGDDFDGQALVVDRVEEVLDDRRGHLVHPVRGVRVEAHDEHAGPCFRQLEELGDVSAHDGPVFVQGVKADVLEIVVRAVGVRMTGESCLSLELGDKALPTFDQAGAVEDRLEVGRILLHQLGIRFRLTSTQAPQHV